MITLKIRQGIRNTTTGSWDASMLAIRSRIGFLILKLVMRKMFPSKDATRVNTCIVMVTGLAPSTIYRTMLFEIAAVYGRTRTRLTSLKNGG